MWWVATKQNNDTTTQRLLLSSHITTMNSQLSDATLSKATNDPYRTRFLLQSVEASKTISSRNRDSKMIQQIGGMAVFDLVVITLCERIAEDPVLDPIYGDFSLKTLIQLQKELLLFAFSEDDDASSSKTAILFRHCELGLMISPSFFEILLLEYVRAIDNCTGDNVDEGVLLECGSRIAKLRPILQETHRQMILQNREREAGSSSATTTRSSDDKENPARSPFTKRASLFHRRWRWQNATAA